MADATIPGLFLTGNHASRPAANAVGSGALYACSTHSLIYQSDASSWSTWATLSSGGSSLTTKGDLLSYDTGLNRLGVGSDGQVLTADSAQSLGIKWATPSGGSSAQAHNELDAAVLVNATSTGDSGSRADHFAGTSIGGAWSSEATAISEGPTVKYSALGLRMTSSAAHHRVQAYTPSGAFRVEARMKGLFSGGGVGLMIRDSSAGDSTGDAMYCWIASTGVAQAYSIDSGSHTQRGSSSAEAGWGTSGCYLAVERNGSNAWTCEVSLDRAKWVTLVSGHSKTFTVAKMGFRLFGTANVSIDFIDVVS